MKKMSAALGSSENMIDNVGKIKKHSERTEGENKNRSLCDKIRRNDVNANSSTVIKVKSVIPRKRSDFRIIY